MAVWQFMLRGLAMTGPWYDDGQTAVPGDADFSTTAAETAAAAAGGDGVNYVGPSPQAQA